MSIENNVTKAKTDDQAQTIKDLRLELAAGKGKNAELGSEMKKLMEDFSRLQSDYKSLQLRKASVKDLASDESDKIKVSYFSPSLLKERFLKGWDTC